MKTPDDKYANAAKEIEARLNGKEGIFSEAIRVLAKEAIERHDVLDRFQEEFRAIGSLKFDLPAIASFPNAEALSAIRDANFSLNRFVDAFDQGIFKKALDQSLPSLGEQLTAASLASASSIFNRHFQSIFPRLPEISLLAERALVQIDFNQLGIIANLPREFESSIRTSHLSFVESYANLLHSLESRPPESYALASLVGALPPVEFYYGNRALGGFTSVGRPEDDDERPLNVRMRSEIQGELEALLARLDKSLVYLWRGALESIKSDNPDRVRHCLTSLRELITHILHRLAPDNDVKLWSSDASLYHDDKPTRKGRMLYICRKVNRDDFGNFMVKDIESVVSAFDVFQEGTHGVSPPFDATQLGLVVIRTESAIRSWLRIHFDNLESDDTRK